MDTSVDEIGSLFAQQGWPCEEVEPYTWHTTFGGAQGERYDLYVLAADEWLHFAVSPLLPQRPPPEAAWLHQVLLLLNQEMRLARLALDADGDVNLLADLPLAALTPTAFGQVIEVLAFYAAALAPELRRLAADPLYTFPFPE
jgi:hypothetical protein